MRKLAQLKLAGKQRGTPTARYRMARKFSIEAMVCGYHIYEDIWDATIGKEQPCQRESVITNRYNG